MTRVDGYLLDTCILDYWHDTRQPQHPHVMARIKTLQDKAPMLISVITIGEIEYGHRVESPLMDTPIQVEFRQFVAERVPVVLDVTKWTAVYYGQMRAHLFQEFSPKKKRNGLRVEQLSDPMTGKELGIQENDLWMAAQAAERNLVFVTGDAMNNIRSVVSDMVRFENWAKA